MAGGVAGAPEILTKAAWPYDWNDIDRNYMELYNFTLSSNLDRDMTNRMVRAGAAIEA